MVIHRSLNEKNRDCPCLWRDRGVALAAFLERRGDEAGCLQLVDKVVQITRCERPAARESERLLDHHEASRQYAIAWMRLGIGDERLLHARHGLEVVMSEKLDRGRRARRAHELRAADGAREIEVVRTAAADRDAHAFAIDLLVRLQP